MYYIGIDLGGMSVKAGLVDEEGRIVRKATCPTLVERGARPIVDDMARLCVDLIRDEGISEDEVKAIGVGLPGIEDPVTGHVPFCTNLYWHEVPVREWMNETIKKPIFIGNDATVAGLAESVAGVSKGKSSSVFVTLGTGVGGGIVLGGKVYSGFHGVGSEIGHMITVSGGDECTCGNKGCWERYASAGAIIRRGREAAQAHPESKIYKDVDGKLEDVTAKIVIDAAKAGDETAVKVFDDYVFHLCEGLVSIINLIDPEVIVLGGGVSHAGQFLLDAINKTLPGMVFYKTMPYADIALATLGNDAGIIGAAMLGK
jgi:glucokinase